MGVDFNTWTRTINGNKKESMLDHVYLDNLENFNSVYFENPVFGNHVLVVVELNKITNSNLCVLKRNWSNYCCPCRVKIFLSLSTLQV